MNRLITDSCFLKLRDKSVHEIRGLPEVEDGNSRIVSNAQLSIQYMLWACIHAQSCIHACPENALIPAMGVHECTIWVCICA